MGQKITQELHLKTLRLEMGLNAHDPDLQAKLSDMYDIIWEMTETDYLYWQQEMAWEAQTDLHTRARLLV